MANKQHFVGLVWLLALSMLMTTMMAINDCLCIRYTERQLVDKYSALIGINDDALADFAARRRPPRFQNRFMNFLFGRVGTNKRQPNELVEDFQLVGRVLSERTDSLSLEANLEVAQKLMDSLGGQLKSDDQTTGSTNSSPIEALGYFLSLGKLNSNETKCNSRAESILRLNDHLTEGRASDTSQWDDTQLSRIDLMVRKAMLGHAKQCELVYLEKYKSVVEGNQLSSETKHELEHGPLSTDGLARLFARDPRLLISMMSGELIDGTSEWRDSMLDLSRELARAMMKSITASGEGNNQNGKQQQHQQQQGKQPKQPKVDKRTIEAAYECHITKPCSEYMRLLADEVFLPASMDVANTFKALEEVRKPKEGEDADEQQQQQELEEMSEEKSQFGIAMGRYEICSALERFEAEFKAEIFSILLKQQHQHQQQ